MFAKRRQSARLMLVAGAALLGGASVALPVWSVQTGPLPDNWQAQTAPPPNYCVRLENGNIHTMDPGNPIVNSVVVQDGKFVLVGPGTPPNRCTPQVIDLGGRTVVPGIIDNHNHVVLLGLSPGHDTRIENATNIKEVMGSFEARAGEVPEGEWLTAAGGFHINQFTPAPGTPRFPMMSELNLITPKHPVFIMQGDSGPSVVNLMAKNRLMAATDPAVAAVGAAIPSSGAIAAGTDTLRVLNYLRSLDAAAGMRIPNQRRGTEYAMKYAAGLGVTTHLDQGVLPGAGTVIPPGGPAVITSTDTLAQYDRYAVYDALLDLYKESKLTNRFRINFLHKETLATTPELSDRLRNTHPHFGDRWLRTYGIGEYTADTAAGFGAGTAWRNGTERVARGYPPPGAAMLSPTDKYHTLEQRSNENRADSPADLAGIIAGWQAVDTAASAGVLTPDGIKKQRWVVSNAPFITGGDITALKDLGAGLSVLGAPRYTSDTAGPPYRTILASGINVGMGSDGGGAQSAPMNPWVNMYYAVTGKNARGVAINPAGERLTREEALDLYTAKNGWFLKEEDKLGTIAPGKFADLVVLSDNYFDGEAVPAEKIRDIYSVFTMVNGTIVWNDLNGSQRKYWSRKWRTTNGYHW